VARRTDRLGPLQRSEDPLSILIADDHPVIRYALLRLFRDQADFEVVGEAASCSELCSKAVELRPDVVVLDLELDDATGPEGVVRLRALNSDCRILVFTARDAEDLALEILRHDLQGVVIKSASAAHLCRVVRAMTRRSLYLDPAVAEALRRRFPAPGAAAVHDDSSVTLSAREYAVLRRIADGWRNRDIAEELGIGERAVKYHVTSVLAKIGARNRVEAVEKAAGLRLLPR
jgi:two-component system, NarL family, response regulator LiaR